MAWAYTQYLTDHTVYRAQQAVQTNRVGLWSDVKPVAPWLWRQEAKTATLAPTAQVASGCFTGPRGGTCTITARDPLHNSLLSVISRAQAVCCVVFLTNNHAIGCKKTPCSPSRSACHSLARVIQRVPRLSIGARVGIT